MKANLKPQNQNLIRDFAIKQRGIDGNKLEALHRLIQIKGEPIEGLPKEWSKKALQFSQDEFISIVHTPLRGKQFYPCKINTHYLTAI